MKIISLLLVLLFFIKADCEFKIQRAIVSSDTNPMYLDFWPIVAKAWHKLGIKPTLALIANKNVKVDTTLGDVIYFEPIDGIPTSQYAQLIRLLLPAYYENEICILSDIDLVPINKKYFVLSIGSYPEDNFLVFRNGAYNYNCGNKRRYPICYVAAKGSIFKDVFGISNALEIPTIIRQWNRMGYGWIADELILFFKLNQWSKFKTNVSFLNRVHINRIDRINWQYKIENLDDYDDAHLLRPYSKFKTAIDQFAKDLKL